VAWSVLTHPDQAAQLRLHEAVDLYRAKFGAEALPHTLIPGAEGVAAQMLADAVQKGEPLGDWAIPARLGIGKPPAGSLY
jgi:hypothetical protein